MKTVWFWAEFATKIFVLVCACIAFYEKDYARACYWLLWLILFEVSDIKLLASK